MTRTYETVQINWSDGATWSGGYTEAQAEETVKFAREHYGRIGVVEVSTFTVEIDPKFAHMECPGCGSENVDAVDDHEGWDGEFTKYRCGGCRDEWWDQVVCSIGEVW